MGHRERQISLGHVSRGSSLELKFIDANYGLNWRCLAEGIFLWNESLPGSSGQLIVIQLRVETSGRRQNWSRWILEIRSRALCRQHWGLEQRQTGITLALLANRVLWSLQGAPEASLMWVLPWGLGGHGRAFSLVGERGEGEGGRPASRLHCPHRKSLLGKTKRVFVHFF